MPQGVPPPILSLPLDDRQGGDMKTETRIPRISALLVVDAMHRGVFMCEREAPLSEIAATMARERVHCVVVESGSGEAGPPWGIVSDLDLVAAAMVRDLDEQTAGGSAATPVVMIAPHETLERAAQLMTEHGCSHLIVVDRAHQRPVGVLSTLDMAASLAPLPAGRGGTDNDGEASCAYAI
jgi:CBS domain-containing protein